MSSSLPLVLRTTALEFWKFTSWSQTDSKFQSLRQQEGNTWSFIWIKDLCEALSSSSCRYKKVSCVKWWTKELSSIFGAFRFLWTDTEPAIASIWWAWTWISNLRHKQYWRKWLEAIYATEALHTENTSSGLVLAGEKFKKFTIFVSLEWPSQ